MFEILQILDSVRKKKFYLMAVFLLAGMLLDIFSLATLVPLIELILGNNSNILTTQVLLFTDKYFNGKALLPFSLFVILLSRIVIKSAQLGPLGPYGRDDHTTTASGH